MSSGGSVAGALDVRVTALPPVSGTPGCAVARMNPAKAAVVGRTALIRSLNLALVETPHLQQFLI